ncbi:hypothetical protein [Hymenobacter cellulosivorans]|uniref:Uncharacterized protein n=1 Tax=Hymenobacter cellulosivorans TaxID=2932249 RepID=A0ABY4FGH3_9BACT|nr:hypothetical protein [Hymenobacter cellulosivorans]UOQ55603.1 hypothetical protein MUN80_12780 [Hymenobacter cellulosivorans]
MKKMLCSAAALLFSVAALAQAPAHKAPRPNKSEARPAQQSEIRDENKDGIQDEVVTTPVNHGQTVQAVAQGTTLTGADKGAAVSSVASARRSTAHDNRTLRSARGERTHGSLRAGGNGPQKSRVGGNAHRSER